MAVRKVDYARFNAALDRLMSGMSGDFDEKAVTAAAYDENETENNAAEVSTADASGSILVQVTMANGAVPVQGARVIISERRTARLYRTVLPTKAEG